MPTLVACTGFEYGTHAGLGFGPFDGVTGTLGTDVQVIAGAAFAGGYGLQVALTAKGPFWTTATLGASKTALVVAMRFRFTVLPSGNTDFISMDVAAATDRAGFFYESATGKVVAWIGGASQTSTAAISINTWYTLEWVFDCSGTNTLDWKLDGVTGTQVSGSAASTVARVQFGNRGVGTGTAQYDNIVASSTGADYPLGSHSIQLLTVDPAGTVATNSATNFRRFTANGTIDGAWNATDVRDAVDEVPPSIGASADGAVQISNNATGYMEFPMTSYTLAGGETISGIRMVACGWAGDATAATIEFRSYNGTTETVVYAVADPGFDASTTAPTWVCRMCTLADFDTQSELDAVAFRVGFSTDAAPDVGIHAIYAEVAVKDATADAPVPWNPQRSNALRDPGMSWWLQRDRRDALTVAAAVANLPSPLDVAFGAGGNAWHQRGGAADAATRYRQGQQRTYADPTLLATAQLEGSLLGGAETRERTNLPATHAARWWMPRQPRRDATTPGLLDTALLEPPLLAGDIRRHGHPALYVDRRDVPQQRAYISDPTFYPTTTPTDPLTVAFGAGGTYWLLYNTAALQIARRAVPQQRAYVSDPALLATALLEGVLLGGADVARHAFFVTDRRSVPQQPARLDFPGDLPADPFLLNGERWRRLATPATHADRREVVPARLVLMFVGTDAPAVFKATSLSSVSAGRTSTSIVSAGSSSASAVTARRTSEGGVT